jgi:hypothetical protein
MARRGLGRSAPAWFCSSISRLASDAFRGRPVLLDLSTVLVLAFLWIARFGTAQTPRGFPGPAVPSWTAGNRITLKLSSQNAPESITYGFLITPKGDMRIGVDQQPAKAGSSGTILLISGRALATRDVRLEPGYEIDTVDGAGLAWQLASQLLERGAPGDPRNLTKAAEIDVLETEKPLHVGTTTASGSYPPPWTAKGMAKPLGAGRVAFDIVFGFQSPGTPPKPYEVRYQGTWECAEPPPAIEDALSLKGWVIYSLGYIRRSDAGGQILDYGASPTGDRYATVGDLRKAIAKKEKQWKD